MPNEHTRLVAEAAKAVLEPHGFSRNGRSQTWFADRGFWLSVIEFQPNLNAPGSFVHVAVHWLWRQPPHVLTLERPRRIGGSGPFKFTPFKSEEQFRPAITALVTKALLTAGKDWKQFASVEETAGILRAEEDCKGVPGGWSTFDAGAAAALSGQHEHALRLLESVVRPEVQTAAARLLTEAREPTSLRRVVRRMVDRERRHFDLPPFRS